MYSVLIVDDEMLIRNRLRLGINWRDCGMRVCGEASNAAEAARFIEANRPDIAVVDIAMPGKSGLDLVRELRGKGCNVKIILLTAHSSFEYARRALRDGVSAYMLKPVHEDEMHDTLKRLGDKLDSEKKTVDIARGVTESQARAEVDRYLLAAIRDFEHPCPEKLPQALENGFWLASLDLAETVDPQPFLSRFGCGGDAYLFYNAMWPKEFLLILRAAHGDSSESAATRIDAVKGMLGVSAETALSDRFECRNDLSRAYAQVQLVRQSRLLYSPAPTSHNQLAHYSGKRFAFSAARQRELSAMLRRGLASECELFLTELFDELYREKMPYSAWRYAVGVFITLLEAVYSETGLPPPDGALRDVDSLFTRAANLDTLAKVLSNPVRLDLGSGGREPRQAATRRICRYVGAHYSDPALSLASIADMMELSPSHISRTFKKDMGVSLISYITDVRMQAAKDLLYRGEHVRDIAERVGYSDEYYFSRCFKKCFGFPPNEIRARV